MNSFFTTLVRWRWLVPLPVLTIIIALTLGAGGLYFATNYRVFFSADNPQLLAFEALQNTYAKDDSVLIAIERRDGATVLDGYTLSAVRDLTERSWQVPFSTRVDSISNYQHSEANGDDLIVDDLFAFDAEATDEKVSQVTAVATQEPLLVGRLIAADGGMTAVNVTVEFPGIKPDEVTEVAAYARTMAAEFEKDYPELKTYLTGMVMLNNAFPEASMKDMATLLGPMYLLIMVLVAVLTRSFAGAVGTTVVIFGSIMGAMGVAGYFGVGLTPISITAPTVIMTLAVADSVHIVIGYRDALKRGLERFAAIGETMRLNWSPVLVTSLTTAIGF